MARERVAGLTVGQLREQLAAYDQRAVVTVVHAAQHLGIHGVVDVAPGVVGFTTAAVES